MNNFLKKILFLLIFASILPQLSFLHNLFAQQSDTVTGSVKISVCGDGVVEGPEDCEGEDLNGETCQSLGYESGTLQCDIACDFDTSDCVPYPTSTPTPTSAISLETQKVEPTATNTPPPSPTPTPILPRLVSVFDLDNSGKIELSEMAMSLRTWVEDFYQFRIKKLRKEEHICDLNEDGTCNLVDFSILLYYIERE